MRKSNAPTQANKRQKLYRSVPTTTLAVRRPTYSNAGRQAFSKQRRATLRYVEVVAPTLSSGLANVVFSANGLFDPNITGVGHQPLYFDQMMAIYNQYTVLGSRMKCTFSTASSIRPVIYSTALLDSTSSPGGVQIQMEQAVAHGMMYRPSAGNNAILKESFSAVKTFGPNPQGNPVLRGTSSANPTEGQFYHIGINDQGLSSAACNLLVEIDYDVIFDELKTMPSS